MQNNHPQQSAISQILKDAFSYWNKTILYQLVFSMLYFSLFFMGYFYLFQYFGLWDEFIKYQDLVRTDLPAFNKKMEEIARLPQMRNFALAFFVLLALINPLNVGLYKIYRKIDMKEPISHSSILSFPNPELRNTFFSNFKDLIETAKELI